MLQYENEINYKLTPESSELISELMEFLSKRTDGSLVEYILEFCAINDYMPEEVGSVIKDDQFMKQIIELDCISNKIFKSDKPTLLDW